MVSKFALLWVLGIYEGCATHCIGRPSYFSFQSCSLFTRSPLATRADLVTVAVEHEGDWCKNNTKDGQDRSSSTNTDGDVHRGAIILLTDLWRKPTASSVGEEELTRRRETRKQIAIA